MIDIKRIILEMKRSYIENFLIVVVFLFSVLLLGAYIGNIQKIDLSIHKLANTIPIQAKITDRSGKNQNGLNISRSIIDKLFQTEYLENIITTSQAYMHTLDNTFISASNSIKAYSFLIDEDVEYEIGFDQQFLNGDNNYCILEKNYADAHHIQLNQTINLPFSIMNYSNQSFSFSYKNIGDQNLRVIGIYDSDNIISDSPKIIVPIRWLRAAVEMSGESFYYDSTRFDLKNPLQLNEFKETMKNIPLHVTNQEKSESYIGDSLIVDDYFFIDSASQLQESLTLYKALLIPFLVLMVIMLSVILFMILHYKRYDIAIAFSLGLSRKRIISYYFFKLVILMIFANVLAVIGLFLFMNISIIHIFLLIGMLFIIDMMSCYLCLRNIMSFNVIQLLAKRD